MESLLAHLLTWISAHPTWAGLAIFFIALSESLIVVGLIVPGVVFMFGIGALIATGHLPLGPSLAWAVAGAIAGDVLSFWVGRHFKQRLRVMWPFSHHPRMLAGGVAFFHRHGGKGVLLGRFIGPLRAIIPAVAGMLNMSPLRFTLANIISALLWAPLYLLPGMVFGTSLTLASEVALRLVVFLLLALGLLWLTAWLLHRMYNACAPHTGMLVYRLLDWGRRHPRLGELPSALLDPQHPEVRTLAALALLLLGAGASFAMISEAVRAHALLGNLDLFVFNALQALRTPQADAIMVWLTALGSTAVVGGITIAGLAWMVWRRQTTAALYWLAAIAVPAALFVVLKHIFAISRPLVIPGLADSYAYPSGHTVMATALYGILAVMLSRNLATRWRASIYTLAGLLIAVIGFSRLYLGVHWLSDVLGGLSLGLVWVALVGMAYRCHYRETPLPTKGLALVTLLALGLSMTLYSTLRYDAALRAYAPPTPPVVVQNGQAWWTRNWVDLPAYRQDLRARHRHPLTVQWVATQKAIRDTLLAQGWRTAPVTTLTRLLQWFRAHPARDALPVLPQVHVGRDEVLRLVKPTHHCLLVLRLWHTGRRLRLDKVGGKSADTRGSTTDATTPSPLFIGTVSCLRETRLMGLSILRTTRNFTAPLHTLEADIAALPHVLRQRSPAHVNTNANTGAGVSITTARHAVPPPGVLLIRGPARP